MGIRKKYCYLFLLISLILTSSSCTKKSDQSKTEVREKIAKTAFSDSTAQQEKPKITFVELGSVNCVPCRMMQPVMKAIEKEFGDQIEVVFYDVWKDPAPGRKYGIRLIPTQIFLDESGDEFFRHEGYFPKEKIEDLFVEKGLKILNHVDVEN